MFKHLTVLAAALALAVVLAWGGGSAAPAARAASCGSGPCLRVDAIPGGGIDEVASVGSTFSVDIVADQLGGQTIAAFNLVLLYNRSVLVASVPQPVGLPAGFDCTLPNPSGDLPEDNLLSDGDPATGDAFIVCFSAGAVVGAQPIVRVAFTAIAAGNSELRLINVGVGDLDGNALVECAPVTSTPGGGCTSASISTSGGGTTPPPPPPPPPGDPNSCLVSYAADGETVVCSDGSRLRFLGVGSPLGADAGAGWATALTNWFLAGKTVTLEFDVTPFDQFGQRFAYPHVIGTDGADYNISALLIYVGMARHVPDGVNTRYDGWLGAAQTWGRTACWNMWSRGNPWGPEAGCF